MTTLYLIETRVGLYPNGEGAPSLGPVWASTREQAHAVAHLQLGVVLSALVGAEVVHRVHPRGVHVLETWSITYGSASFTVRVIPLPYGLKDINYPYWESP